MKEKLIDFIVETVDFDECQFTYGKMSIGRCSLRNVNPCLYDKLQDLVDIFVEDHELPIDWFENNFIDIDDLFDDVLV